MPQKPPAPHPAPPVCSCHRIPYPECEAKTAQFYRYVGIRVAVALLVVLVLLVARFATVLAMEMGLF